MHAALGLAKTVSVLAGHDERRAFDSGSFARQRISDVHFPAARFAPALVHAQQHTRPIAGFGPTRAGVDAHDAIVLVVWPAEKNFQFKRVEFLGETRQVAFQISEM